MSPSPSVVFSAFRSTSDPRLKGWVAFRESVRAGAPAVRAAEGRERHRPGGVLTAETGRAGIWRLLASNSRELGRSSSVYGSFAGARTHVLELKDLCDAMVTTVVTGPTAGTHGWVITVADVVVMTAGRWYGAASASREASAGTIEAFRIAFITVDARHPSEDGRRGSRVLTEAERAVSW